MKINPTSLGLTAALAAAMLWIVYSVCVFSLIVVAINLSGDMAYTNFASFEGTQFFYRFLVNLAALSFCAGLPGWLAAGFYNRLNENSDTKLPYSTRIYQ